MQDVELFGQFDYLPEDIEPDGKLIITLQPIELMTSWKRCGLTADFIAAYYSGFNDERRAILENTISTVLNELIENAAKFSKQIDSLVTITIKQYINLLLIEVENEVTIDMGNRFKEYLAMLKSDDVTNLYFDRLEKRNENDSTSGLGILMILKDYSASLVVKFSKKEKNGSEYYEITTKILLYLEG